MTELGSKFEDHVSGYVLATTVIGERRSGDARCETELKTVPSEVNREFE
jgi:hypothetical protein